MAAPRDPAKGIAPLPSRGPTAPGELSAPWVTWALSQGGLRLDAPVASIEVETLKSQAALTGSVARVRLRAPGAGLPPSLIAKFPASTGPTRALAERFDLYRREARFYRELAATCGVPTPRPYYTPRDDEPSVLLIEDLVDTVSVDVVDGASFDQVAAVVELLAPMHARFWNDTALAAHSWLPAPNNAVILELVGELGTHPWRQFRRQFARSLPADVVDIGDRLAVDRTVLDRLSAAPWTLVHGDMRIHNILFRSDRPAQPRAVIDWQTATRGRGPLDLAHLFVNSLDVEDRRRAEADLLPRYHALLRAAGVAGYELEDCRIDYRLAVANQFSQVVALNALIDPLSKLDDEVATSTGARLVAALRELRVLDILPPTRRQRVRARVKRVLPAPARRLARAALRRR